MYLKDSFFARLHISQFQTLNLEINWSQTVQRKTSMPKYAVLDRTNEAQAK